MIEMDLALIEWKAKAKIQEKKLWRGNACCVKSRISAFSLTLAFAVFGLTTWALSALPIQVITVLATAFPLASYACLRTSIATDVPQGSFDPPLTREGLSSIPLGLFSILTICMIISVLAKLLVPMNEMLLVTNYRLYWSALFVLIFLLYAIWMIVLKRDDQDQLWPIYVLIIFSGLLCYTTFSTTQPEFAAGFFRATQECLMLFCWIVTTAVVYRNKLPRVFSFAAAVLIFLEPPTLVSTMIPMFFPSMNASGGEPQAIIITAVMTFILVVATGVLFWSESFANTRSRKRGVKAESSDPLLAVIDQIMNEYGLTKREGEIVLCLSKGYTLPQTAEMLFISLDTVRTHVKAVYRKTGVHKKRQLIAIIEKKSLTDT